VEIMKKVSLEKNCKRHCFPGISPAADYFSPGKKAVIPKHMVGKKH